MVDKKQIKRLKSNLTHKFPGSYVEWSGDWITLRKTKNEKVIGGVAFQAKTEHDALRILCKHFGVWDW